MLQLPAEMLTIQITSTLPEEIVSVGIGTGGTGGQSSSVINEGDTSIKNTSTNNVNVNPNINNDVTNNSSAKVGNVSAKSGDSTSNSTSKATGGNATANGGKATSSSSSGSSSASNGNQTVNIKEGSTINLPNYMQLGNSSVTSEGGSYTTSSIGIQGYIHNTGDDSIVQSGVVVGLSIPLGVDRAKKAQDLAIEKARNANTSQLIQTAILLKQNGFTVKDTPETHQLYVIMQNIVK